MLERSVWNHSTGAQLKRITPVAELDCYVMRSACGEHARADDLEIARAQLVATTECEAAEGHPVLETRSPLKHVVSEKRLGWPRPDQDRTARQAPPP